MSLKSKRIIILLVSIVAAIAIITGMWCYNEKKECDAMITSIEVENGNYQSQATTQVPVTEAEADDSEPTTMESVTEEGSEPTTMESVTEEANWNNREDIQEEHSIQEEQAVVKKYNDLKNKSDKYRMYYLILIFIGTVLDIVLIVMLFKNQFEFVVELSISVVLVAVYEIMHLTFDLMPEVIVAFCAITAMPYAIQNILKWIARRCTLDACVPHKLGLYMVKRDSKPHTYVVAATIWMLLCVLLGVGTFALYRFDLINQIEMTGWIITFIVFTVIAFFTIVKFAKQLSHLEEQLDRMHKGGPVEAADGIFNETESNLSLFREEREIAIANALKSERFKVDLITNVSHDLRTPLTSILGNGELLTAEEMSEVGRKRLEALNRKTEYMIDLVDRLFELTKVSSGVIEPKREDIDLIKLIEQTIGLYEEKLTSGRLTVKRHFCKDAVMINTDGAMLHQIVSNLLGNAIKYSPCDSRIHVRVDTTADNRLQIRISNVSAYEMDFTAEEIVQRFARGDKARSTSGSGIGLAIVKTYADALDAEFHIEIDDEQFIATVEM